MMFTYDAFFTYKYNSNWTSPYDFHFLLESCVPNEWMACLTIQLKLFEWLAFDLSQRTAIVAKWYRNCILRHNRDGGPCVTGKKWINFGCNQSKALTEPKWLWDFYDRLSSSAQS